MDPEVSVLCRDGERNSSRILETTIWVNVNKCGVPSGYTTIRDSFLKTVPLQLESILWRFSLLTTTPSGKETSCIHVDIYSLAGQSFHKKNGCLS